MPHAHIPPMPDHEAPAPARSAASPYREFRPFCSKRCADVDLHRWLSGVYAVPVTEDEEEDERRDARRRTGELTTAFGTGRGTPGQRKTVPL